MLMKEDYVIGMVVVAGEATLLVVSEKGMGKRTDVEDYRKQRRGGKGVINIKTSPKTGKVVAIKDKYGVQHMYAHLDHIAVKVGDHVAYGQIIGNQGMTPPSHCTGPHLHYEVRLKCSPSGGWGSDTDPIAYLQQYFAKETPAPILSVEKANQYITWLKEEYYEEPESKRKMIGEIADILRIVSGQRPQNR